ncbi:MBG domain-containing protein [Brevifollis gellanilyticus]|uniref:RCC1 domain-containing protein n=1 Tax=Brevifollis gellanilyticus TaxID=748831 RepID=UPI001478BBF8|nr:MBG domain-containing protein [Brevifollis gellanilyticus]
MIVLSVLPSSSLRAGEPQSITFTAIPDQLTTSGPVTLSASASSGLPVAFSIVSTPARATVTGDTLTLTGSAGSVTVKAVQAGNGAFDPAPPVFRTFVIGEASQRFVKVAAGYTHSAGIRADGTLWMWGMDGFTVQTYAPVQVGSGTQWSQVACGEFHTMGIQTDGSLWAMGWNIYGALGDGTTSTRLTPVRIGTANDWVQVACGQLHTLALRADGTLWGCGDNSRGQVGANSASHGLRQIGSATNWSQVSCGMRHTAAIRTDGTLWCWGDNFKAQLGNGSLGGLASSPTQMAGTRVWARVTCGVYHTVALDADGHLLSWGSNTYDQLGTGPGDSLSPALVPGGTDWATVVAGGYFTLAVKKNGTLWGWGANSSGQLGDGTRLQRQVPWLVDERGGVDMMACGTAHCLMVRGGLLFTWGRNRNGETGDTNTQSPGPATQFTSLPVAGVNHAIELRADGTLWGLGDNASGELANGTLVPVSTRIQIGSGSTWATLACGQSHTLAVRTDGTLWGWGSNFDDQLAQGPATHSSFSTPVQIGNEAVWESVSTSTSNTLAIRQDGTLWGWGSNDWGQLGLGSFSARDTPAQVSGGGVWKDVTCGHLHTVALREDGTLWTWGEGAFGRLGDGTLTTRSTPAQIAVGAKWKQISSGLNHTAALREDGTLWCWGSNFWGALGDGTTASRASPVQVGTGTDWVAVSCGGYHTLALKSDGSLWAWGDNGEGQAGTEDGGQHELPLRIGEGNVWSSLPKQQGRYSSYARSRDGTVWSFGRDGMQQLGKSTGPATSRSRCWPVAVGQSLLASGVPALVAASKPLSLPVTTESGLPVTYRVLSGPAVVEAGSLTATAPGTLELLAFLPGDESWMAAVPVCLQFTAQTGQQSIHFPALADRPASSGSFTLSASASSALPVTYRVVSGPATVSGNTMTLTGVTGTVVIEATQSGNAAWHAAEPVQVSFAATTLPVVTVAQSILFSPPASVVLAESPLVLAARASSGMAVNLTLISGPPGTALDSQTLIFSAPGTVKIRATQGGNASFLPAPAVDRTIQIKATPTAMTLLGLVQTYTSTPRAVRVVNAPVTPATIRYKTGTVWSNTPPTNAGSYTVEVVSGSVKKTATLVIQKAPLWVIPQDQVNFTGFVNPPLTYVYSGFLGGDTAASSVTRAPVISTTATKSSLGGVYPIRATGGASSNYQLLAAQGSLTVATLAGQYEALVYPYAYSQTNDGGSPDAKLEFTVSANSRTYSGKLTTALEKTPVRFSGEFPPMLYSQPLLPAQVSNVRGFGDVQVYFYGPNRIYNRYRIEFNVGQDGGVRSEVNADNFTGNSSASRRSRGFSGRRVGTFTGRPAVGNQGMSTVLLMPPYQSLGVPPAMIGYGHLSARTDAKGVMTLAGAMADGTRVTASLQPDATFGYRLYVQPFGAWANSFLGGLWLLQPHPDLPGRRYLPPLTSYLYGHKGGMLQFRAMIDPWLPPQAAKPGVPAISLSQRLALNPQSQALMVNYHALPEGLTVTGLPMSTSISATGALSVPNPNPRAWKLTVNPANGLVSGSFNVLQGTKSFTVPFQGILRQPPSTEAAETALMGGASALVPQLSGQSGGATTTQIIFGR